MRRLLAALAMMSGSAIAAPPPEAPAPTETERIQPEEAKTVLGQQVFTPEGQAVGRLVDVLVDQDGAPRAGVIDFGGFMGLGNRRVSVAWSALRFDPASKDRPIVTTLAPDQLRAAPEYKAADKPAVVVSPTPPQPAPQTPADPQTKPDEQVPPDGG